MLSSIIQSRKQLYSYKMVDGKKVFTEISAEDIIELETVAAAGSFHSSTIQHRTLPFLLTLPLIGSRQKWFPSNSEDQDVDKDFLKESDVIKFIQETTGPVNISTSGMTYYYFPIEHPRQKRVVMREHAS